MTSAFPPPASLYCNKLQYMNQKAEPQKMCCLFKVLHGLKSTATTQPYLNVPSCPPLKELFTNQIITAKKLGQLDTKPIW